KNGGLGRGGLNFDAKVRRGSFEPEDLFRAHIVGMDSFAVGLKVAQKLLDDKVLENIIEDRYSSFTEGIGKDIVEGNTDFHKLEEWGVAMKYVIGIDLGTSAVKILLVNRGGDVVQEVSKPLPLIQEKAGYSEQNPKDWVDQTVSGLSDLMKDFNGNPEDIEGISFSGQMHGLVLLDKNNEVLRNAILWN